MPKQQQEQPDNLSEILRRQTRALEALARHFAPAHMEDQARRWRWFATRLVAVFSIGISGSFGGWEFVKYIKLQWDIRRMADRYAEVANEVYFNESNANVAMEFLSKAIELKPIDPNYRYLKAYIDGMSVVRRLMNLDRPLNKEEMDQAHSALANAVMLKGLSAKRPEPYILQGQVYAALGETDRAFAEFRQAIGLDPKNDFAHMRLAVLLSTENKIDEALNEIEEALRLNPDSKWAWMWKGVILADQRKDWDGARQAYGKALDLDPRFDLALYNLGWSWLKQDPPDYKKAREQMEKALAVNPDFKEAYYGMGMIYGYQNLYEIAGLYFKKALAVDETFLTAWKWHGIVEAEQGNYEEALTDFSRAIDLAPSLPELYVRRARVFEKTDKTDKAVFDLRFASELKPGDKQIWLYLGDVFLKANEPDKAMDYYQRAIQIDPQYAEAFAQSAQVWVKRGKRDEALKALDQAIQVATYRPERFLMERARLLEEAGESDKALQDYRAASASDPALGDAWLAQAKLLQHLNRKPEAIAAIGKYIELHPADKAGQELQTAIQNMS